MGVCGLQTSFYYMAEMGTIIRIISDKFDELNHYSS